MWLKNVKIINHHETISNADVLIEGTLIKEVVCKPGIGEKLLIPGFIDTHIHGYGNYDVMESTSSLENISKLLKGVGTVAFLPTVMTAPLPKIHESLTTIAKANVTGAKILGIHLEGPFIAHAKRGAHDENYLLQPSSQIIADLQKSAQGLIKKMTIAPELFSDELIKSVITEQKIMPSIGHTNCTAEQALNAINLGINAATHAWNAMSGVQNRQPGALTVILSNDQIYAELICDLNHVDAFSIALTIKSKGRDRIIAVTDALKIAGMPDGESISGGLSIIKNKTLITIKGTNTLAGSAITMYDNFINLINLGYSLEEVVGFTSYNAAQSLKLTKMGEVKIGNFADLILLDKDLKILQVWVNGVADKELR